jgi:DNA modification methylase
MAKRRGPEQMQSPKVERNTLYYGDNLDVLRSYIEPESVDLVYLDPPFQSGRDYNVIYGGESQERAFVDTWQWDSAAAAAYDEVVRSGHPVGLALQAFLRCLGHGQMLAYQSMMAVRLLELHRVLRPSGSLYLHCDPTASHYLKIVLDAIFGSANFRNEIVWRRARSHNDRKIRRFGAVHDTLLFYSKSDAWLFNPQYLERDASAPKTHDLYVHTDGKTYRKDNCRAPGDRGPRYEWNGHTHHWRFSPEERDRLIAERRIVYSKSGMPRVLRPIDPERGAPLQDVWNDIDAPNPGSRETLGYPTQKPLALLERIILTSSNPGDTVLDPFCGCGTTVEAAHKLGRRWMGIDITHLAIRLIKERLSLEPDSFTVIGEPADLAGAQELASHDTFQFQQWALGLIGARPPDGTPKKGKDRGVDGVLHFQDGLGTAVRQIIVSVKSGKPKVSELRDLHGVVTRDHAVGGVMVALEPPTRDMRTEAAAAGFYLTTHGKYPVLQIVTIDDLLHGKRVNAPPLIHGKVRRTASKQLEMSLPLVAGAPASVALAVDSAAPRKGPKAAGTGAKAASEQGARKARK